MIKIISSKLNETASFALADFKWYESSLYGDLYFDSPTHSCLGWIEKSNKYFKAFMDDTRRNRLPWKLGLFADEEDAMQAVEDALYSYIMNGAIMPNTIKNKVTV